MKRGRPSGTKKRDTRKYMTQQETQKFFKVIKSKRDGYMFNLILYLGLRVTEASKMRLDAIDDTGYLYIQGLKGGRARGYDLKKRRQLWTQHKAWLRDRKQITHSEKNPYLFITDHSGKHKPIKIETIKYLFKVYAKRAGLSGSFSIHSLRHTCGCFLAAKGFPAHSIMRWLRQKRITSAQVYVELVGEEMLKEEESISQAFNS